MITRRRAIAALISAIAVAVAFAAAGSSSAQSALPFKGVHLTAVNFGGVIDTAERNAWEIPFGKLTGATFSDDLQDYAKLQAQVESGDVTWNLSDTDAFFANEECGKLFVPRDPKIVTSLSNALPGSVTNKCGVPTLAATTLLAYNTADFKKNPPTTWADFFNTKKYPGKRSVWNYVLNGVPEAALLADGVSPAHLYPLDVSRAFKKLQTIKSDILFATTLGQQQQQVASGQASMAMIFTGRLEGAVASGAKWAPVWNQNMRIWDNEAVVKGSANVKASMAFLEYLLKSSVQNAIVKYVPYTSMVKGPPPKTDALTKRFLATSQEYKEGLNVDSTWWAQNYNKMTQLWTSFTTS